MKWTEAHVRSLCEFSHNNAEAITPDDLGDHPYDELGCTASGTVKIDFLGGGTGITVGLSNVDTIPYKVTRVYATGTTATGIYGINKRI